MTRVDFYILEEPAEQVRLTLACRLCDKAFRLGHRVYVHAPDAQAAAQLDQTMWTFNAGSFVPHSLAALPADYPEGAPAPVLIGHGDEPPDEHWDLLVNTATDVPLFFSRYRRVAEVIGGDDAQRDAGRARYRFYRDRGYELHSHRL